MGGLSRYSDMPDSDVSDSVVDDNDRLIGPAGLHYTLGELKVCPISTALAIYSF